MALAAGAAVQCAARVVALHITLGVTGEQSQAADRREHRLAGSGVSRTLPAAWNGQQETIAGAIWNALAAQQGEPIAWPVFRKGMIDAIHTRLLQTTPSSLPVEEAQPSHAPRIRLAEVSLGGAPPPPLPPPPLFPSQYSATTALDSLQIGDLADRVSELMTAAIDCGLTFN